MRGANLVSPALIVAPHLAEAQEGAYGLIGSPQADWPGAGRFQR